MKKTSFLLTIAACCLMACSGSKKQDSDMQSDETRVLLETTMGNITLKLYNETPLHRDNFIKLVREGVYDSTLFHRVIRDFMVQAGDPMSKNAADTAMLGEGDLGYRIPAEFVPGLFHKKGVLAAAREGDDVNPEKASSSCQFYIVTGKVFTEPKLINMENSMNDALKDYVFQQLRQAHARELLSMRKAGNIQGVTDLQDSLDNQAREYVRQNPALKFSKRQIQAYTTVGGAPHLDGNYTVFGEVTEGMEVVDKIQIVKTNAADRPINNVRIIRASVIE